MEINFPKPPRVGKPKTTNRYRFEIALDSTRDADVIEILEKQVNKSDYIRRLVRKDAQ